MTGTVALAAASLLLVACNDSPDRPSFTEDLADFDAVEAQQVTLDNGVEIAIGSDDDDRFVVQWRDDGGSKWSAPKTVADGSDLDASKVTLEARGDTAFAGLDWYDEDDDERESYGRSDALVCRAFDCELLEDAGEPMADTKGRYAVARVDEDDFEYAVWRAGEGWGDTITLEGVPKENERAIKPRVYLLGDRSFVTVIGREAADGCTFELLSSKPEEAELEVVAATTPRLQDGCYAENVAADGDEVTAYNRDIDQQISFTRDGKDWTDDLSATGGLLPIDPAAGFGMVLTELEDDSSVAIGSPDLRTIVAQRRPTGQTEWSTATTLLRAPAGEQCHTARADTIFEHTDVAYLVLCWPNGSDWGDEYDDTPPPSAGYAVASVDGTTWVTQRVLRPAYELLSPVSEPMLVARGGERSLVWRPGARAFQALNLPLANPTVDAVLVTRNTAIRVTGNPDDTKPCRPTWSVAPVTATAWGPSSPITPIEDWAKGPKDCYGVIIDHEDLKKQTRTGVAFRVAGVVGNGSIDGVLTRTGKGWTFTGG